MGSNAMLVVRTTCWQCDARARRRARETASGGPARAPARRRRVVSRLSRRTREGVARLGRRRRRVAVHPGEQEKTKNQGEKRAAEFSAEKEEAETPWPGGRAHRVGVGSAAVAAGRFPGWAELVEAVVSHAPQQNPVTARQLEACWELQRCSWECVRSWDTFRKFEFSKFASTTRRPARVYAPARSNTK